MDALIEQPLQSPTSPTLRERRTTSTAGRRINARDAERLQLRGRLADKLACLEDGHFLVLQTRDDEPYYVQFAAHGADGLWAEAVSNRFLHGWRRLDRTAHGRPPAWDGALPPTSATARSTGGGPSLPATRSTRPPAWRWTNCAGY
jgi:T3SS (YopN, CesT) and YbjN peptide-binding chaperone 3